jgi:hypothetical protein
MSTPHIPTFYYPAKRRDRTGRTRIQPWKGFFLGIPVADGRHYVHSFDIEPGDMLLVFTDCLIETRTTAGEIFGQEGILDTLPHCRRDTADALLTDLLNGFFAATGTSVLRDDLLSLCCESSDNPANRS